MHGVATLANLLAGVLVTSWRCSKKAVVVALLGGRNRCVRVTDFAVGACAATLQVGVLAGRNRSDNWMDVACGVRATVSSDARSRCCLRFGGLELLPNGVGGCPFIEANARLPVLLGTGICSLSGVH